MGILDPWSNVGVVGRTLSSAGFGVWRNEQAPWEPAESHEDALQPQFYRRVRKEFSFECIVTSPVVALLDVALPLAVLFAPVVAVHVPGGYVTSAHPARLAYLKGLAQQGRLALLLGLPQGPLGRRYVWIVVFATEALRRRRLRSCLGPGELWALV